MPVLVIGENEVLKAMREDERWIEMFRSIVERMAAQNPGTEVEYIQSAMLEYIRRDNEAAAVAWARELIEPGLPF